jgi:hypothetical protein
VISCFLRSANISIYYPVLERSKSQPAHQNRAFLAVPLYEKAPYKRPVSLTIGDEILFESAGAYTATYSSVGFNGFSPLVVRFRHLAPIAACGIQTSNSRHEQHMSTGRLDAGLPKVLKFWYALKCWEEWRRRGARGAMKNLMNIGPFLAILIAGTVIAHAETPRQRSKQVPRTTLTAGPAGLEVHFDAASWRAYVEGKTLYYSTPSGILGREYYPVGGDKAVYIYFDGRCFDGEWAVEADGLFCFQYDGAHCFEHFERDGKVIARETDGDEQVVVRVTDEVLSCAPDLLG